MAVQNKPERHAQHPLQRPAQQRVAAPQRSSVQRAVAQARPATVNKSLLNNARSVFAHKTAQKPVHVANAQYSTGPRPQSPLRAVTKDLPGSSSGGLPSHHDAVAFLDSFLARAGKNRIKA